MSRELCTYYRWLPPDTQKTCVSCSTKAEVAVDDTTLLCHACMLVFRRCDEAIGLTIIEEHP